MIHTCECNLLALTARASESWGWISIGSEDGRHNSLQTFDFANGSTKREPDGDPDDFCLRSDAAP